MYYLKMSYTYDLFVRYLIDYYSLYLTIFISYAEPFYGLPNPFIGKVTTEYH